jgi:hypothetical protein
MDGPSYFVQRMQCPPADCRHGGKVDAHDVDVRHCDTPEIVLIDGEVNASDTWFIANTWHKRIGGPVFPLGAEPSAIPVAAKTLS